MYFTPLIILLSHSSALDTRHGIRVALKKLSRPFQSNVHSKRTYREVRLLKHMKHENVRGAIEEEREKGREREVVSISTISISIR